MSEVRSLRGTKARLSGRRAEWQAALYLMAKGYRILGFRLKTTQAEIDLVALRGKTLAVIEVKQRTGLDDALQAVTLDQRRRLRKAGRLLAARLTTRLSVWTSSRSLPVAGRAILSTLGEMTNPE